MTVKDESSIWPQPRGFAAAEEKPVQTTGKIAAPAVDTSTGVEGIRYETKTNAGMPKMPGSVGKVVKKGVVAAANHVTPARLDNTDELINFLEGQKSSIHMPTEEDMEKERRRRRTDGIIAGFTDAARAVSNLYFTSQYAPNMYNPRDTMSERVRARYDRIKKEREADADRYMRYSLMIGKLKDDRAQREHQRRQDDHMLALKRAESERKDALGKLDMFIKMQGLDKAASDAERARIQAKYEEAVQMANLIYKDAQTSAAHVSASEHWTNVRGKYGPLYIKGVPHWYHTEEAYYDAAREVAASQKIPLDEEVKTETESYEVGSGDKRFGQKRQVKTGRRKRTDSEVAAAVNERNRVYRVAYEDKSAKNI